MMKPKQNVHQDHVHFSWEILYNGHHLFHIDIISIPVDDEQNMFSSRVMYELEGNEKITISALNTHMQMVFQNRYVICSKIGIRAT